MKSSGAETLARQGVDADQLAIHADPGTSMSSKPVTQLLVDLGVCLRPPLVAGPAGTQVATVSPQWRDRAIASGLRTGMPATWSTLLGAVGADAHYHQRAEPVVFESDVGVDAVDPPVHVVHPDRSRSDQAAGSACHDTVRRSMVDADRAASVPKNSLGRARSPRWTGPASTAPAAPRSPWGSDACRRAG